MITGHTDKIVKRMENTKIYVEKMKFSKYSFFTFKEMSHMIEGKQL